MVLFLLALLQAAPAAATGNQTAPPPATIVVEGKKKRKICRTYDAPTGSHIGEQQICKTQTEWDIQEAAADRSLSRENQRTNALNSQLLNEQNAFAGKKPH